MTGTRTTVALYDQEFTVGDGSGRMGDCLRACVATLLQIDPANVPNFVEHPDWLRQLLAFHDGALTHEAPPEFPAGPGPWVIGCGPGPRGHAHAVILSAADGSLVHDPHPSRDGLAGRPTWILSRKVPA